MKNKKKLSVLALALVLCLGIVGISAYFTDGDTATNEFTVGAIEIDLQETLFVEGSDNVNELLPQEDIAKNPTVVNTSATNEAYVFVEVIVPCAKVETALESGEKVDEAKTQLFSWDVNDGWVLVDQEINDDHNHFVYAYAADGAMTSLAPGKTTTTAVFDYVRFANVTENAGLENGDQAITVNAYAIQTTNLNDDDTDIDGANDDGKTAPEAVWSVMEGGSTADNLIDVENTSTTADAINNGTAHTEDSSTDEIQ